MYLSSKGDKKITFNVKSGKDGRTFGTISTKQIAEKLNEFKEKNVKVYASKDVLSKLTCVREATDDDFATEFLDYAISVKTVASVDEAIEHISKYSTKHSECIVTEDKKAADLFTACIDAAAVYVNASTRFTDGFEFGFGAEIGISTQKMHARGPMALPELTTYKWLIVGNGQTRP